MTISIHAASTPRPAHGLILPQRARDRPAAIRMDLHMMLLLGARERTKAEFEVLLDRTGFRTERLVPTRSPAGLSVIEATPA